MNNRHYIGNNLFLILVLFSLVNLFGTWGYFSPQKEAEAYAHMDQESREMYRSVVVNLAKHSDFSELEIAELALSLARESQHVPEGNPVLAHRRLGPTSSCNPRAGFFLAR